MTSVLSVLLIPQKTFSANMRYLPFKKKEPKCFFSSTYRPCLSRKTSCSKSMEADDNAHSPR